MTCKKFQNHKRRSTTAQELINKQIFTYAQYYSYLGKLNLYLFVSSFSSIAMELKELPIGSIIKYKGIRLRICEAVQNCRGCYFRKLASCPYNIIGVCCLPWRETNVIFRKIDKNKKENNHVKYKQKK